MISSFRPLAKALCLSLALVGGPAHCDDEKALRTLLALIRTVEAPAGYDDYFRGVSRPPPALLTTMTVGEVLAWQDDIDPHSISEASGGYQIMEDTLRDLVANVGVDPDVLFSPQTQDQFAIVLLEKAGWAAFRKGSIGVREFGDNVARVWAGLPLLSGPSRGQSAYHGIAGNKALISAERFEQALQTLDVFDVATLGRGAASTPSRAPVPAKPTNDGFAPSIVITWTTDPFYQD